MSNKLVDCPYCNQKLMKGAMRCVACGRILQTTEERIAVIEKLQAKKKFNVLNLIKPIVMIIVFAILYYHYSDKIIEIIKSTFGK